MIWANYLYANNMVAVFTFMEADLEAEYIRPWPKRRAEISS